MVAAARSHALSPARDAGYSDWGQPLGGLCARNATELRAVECAVVVSRGGNTETGSGSRRDVLRIDRRFCGPPESGNGGYVCGRLASFVDAAVTAVRLRVPPPLETELDVRHAEGCVELLADDVLVAEARAADLALEPPEPPSFEEAEAASRRYRGFDAHWFPSCFVCGPKRKPHDGLCIFPGPLEGRSMVAGAWIPDPSLAGSNGRVSPEFVWAALDCPGAFAFPEPRSAAVLLGELRVERFGDVSPGERCVLVAWEVAHEGRKHETATALFGESGDCRSLGLGTWLEVAEKP